MICFQEDVLGVKRNSSVINNNRYDQFNYKDCVQTMVLLEESTCLGLQYCSTVILPVKNGTK